MHTTDGIRDYESFTDMRRDAVAAGHTIQRGKNMFYVINAQGERIGEYDVQGELGVICDDAPTYRTYCDFVYGME